MNKKSIFISGKEIILPGSIEKILDLENIKIVLYSGFDSFPKIQENYAHNIWAFDIHGDIKWKVASPNEGGYSSIWIDDSGKLMAYGGSGYDYIINQEDGTVSLWVDPSWPPGYKPRPW